MLYAVMIVHALINEVGNVLYLLVIVDYCARRSEMCLNGGTCISTLRGAVCECTQYWRGHLCGQGDCPVP